jgi:hypothetical protein
MRALVLLAALCVASAAQGATITVHPEDSYGRIFVDIAGDINLADIKNFSDKVEHLPSESEYVLLSSEGGDARAAAIGEYIRLSGMKTLVPENKRCVSVCAFIWLGAHARYLGAKNFAIGFHGAYNVNTGQRGSTNLMIAVYLGYLGFSYSAADWILSAPPLAMHWLTPETSKQYSVYHSELTPIRSVPFADAPLADISSQPERPPSSAPAPSLLGKWAIGDQSNCEVPNKVYSLRLDGGTIVWQDQLGDVDIETVIFSGESEFRTTTANSIHKSGRNYPLGTSWIYLRNGLDGIQVTESNRRTFQLARCR